MRLIALVTLGASCASSPAGPVVGSASLNIDGTLAATAAWMVPASLSDDTQPDLPVTYLGWSVVTSLDPPGTPCSAVVTPAWTAELVVYSPQRGDLPEDAPIVPGTFDVTTPAGPPHAGIQAFVHDTSALGEAGTVTISAFDNDHLDGSIAARGTTTDLAHAPFTIHGTFQANRCD